MDEELRFRFSPEKNAKLIKLRGVSFEDVIFVIERHGALDVVQHPNQNKYPHQKMYVVAIRNYVYLVPFVQEGKMIFLKTIFPSRKATKQYLN